MRILITNDDGINAPGLAALEEIARAVAGPDGELWTVAPANEQSGVAHCINYTKPTMITELGPRRFAVEGAPADCVIAAVHHVMPARPDLILSGVNKGNNSAENALYSGTLGAALEGALQNLPSIALSQYYGPANAGLNDPFETARVHGADVVQRILKVGFDTNAPYCLFYNVNFPPVPAADVKGTRAAAQGRRPGECYGAQPFTAPSGRTYLWVKGPNQQMGTAEGSDAAANLDGYISVTPMRADFTDQAALARVAEALA